MALDAGLVALAYYLAYRLRFDGGIPSAYMDLFERTIAWAIFGSILCFSVVGMYRHWMRYSSQREYLKIAEGTGYRRPRAGRLRDDRAAQADHDADGLRLALACPLGCSCSTAC